MEEGHHWALNINRRRSQRLTSPGVKEVPSEELLVAAIAFFGGILIDGIFGLRDVVSFEARRRNMFRSSLDHAMSTYLFGENYLSGDKSAERFDG